jgi:hypothetical protein
MKTINLMTLITLVTVLAYFGSCKKSENEIELPYNYAGGLTLEYRKGFPSFSSSAMLGVNVTKDGMVTFDGGGASSNFDAEDIYYEGAEPVTKVRMVGTLTFHGATGEVKLINEKESILVRVSSSIAGQMTVWAWGGDESGWVQALDIPWTYEDKYSDGTLQYTLVNASGLTGESIKKTLPDMQGTFTYGYTLLLIPFR